MLRNSKERDLITSTVTATLLAASILLARDACGEELELNAFAPLVRECPTAAALTQVNAIGRDAGVQRINHGSSDEVRLDDFAVDIGVFPKLPGATKASTSIELLEFVRTHLGSFLDPDIATANAFDDKSKILWAKPSTALGSLILFKISWGSTTEDLVPIPRFLPIEQALVVTSSIDSNKWQFSTVRAGLANPGEHPLSGIREFGFRLGKNNIPQIYTRGIDRLTSWQEIPIAGLINKGQTKTWETFFQRLAVFINANGGAATVHTGTVQFFNWKRDFVDGKIPVEICIDVRPLADANIPQARNLSIATGMLGDADPSGQTIALASSAISKLSLNLNAQEKSDLFGKIRSLQSSAHGANSPIELLSVINSKVGKEFGLSSRTLAWDTDAMKFINGREFSANGGSDNIAGAPDLLIGPSIVEARKVVREKGASISGSDMQSLLIALMDNDDASPGRVIAAISPPSQRVLLSQVYEAASAGYVSDDQLRLMRNRLADATAAKVREAIEDAGHSTPFASDKQRSDFQTLLNGNFTVSSVAASAGVLETLALGTGNEALAKDVRTTASQLRAAAQMYQGAMQLAEIGATGGTLAALSILSSSGALGGTGSDDSQNLTSAIADLTDLIKSEFVKVNYKLDRMQNSLDQISADLRQLGHLQEQTLTYVQETREALNRYFVTFGQFEASLKQLIQDTSESPCRSFRLGYIDGNVNQDLFFQCLSIYRTIANTNIASYREQTGLLREDLNQAMSLGSFAVDEDLWLDAALIARGANEFLGLSAARDFQARGQELASGKFITAGLNNYLLWLARYGENYVPSKFNEILAGDGLSKLKQRIELQGSFKRALHGQADQVQRALKNLVTSAEERPKSDGWQKASDDIYEAAENATIDFVLKERVESADGSPRAVAFGALPFASCDVQDTRIGASTLSAQQLLDAGLPKELLYFGNRSRGSIYSPSTSRGQDNSLASLPGLEICFKTLGLDAHDAGGYIIARYLTADVLIKFGYSEICPQAAIYNDFDGTRYAPKPASPPWESIAAGAVLKAITNCFVSISQADKRKLFHDAAFAYLTTYEEQPVVRLSVLSALGKQFELDASLAPHFDRVMADQSSVLAFLRGYINLVFPSTWMSHDSLRKELLDPSYAYQGNDVRAVARCAAEIQSRIGRQINPSATDIYATADAVCPNAPFRSVFKSLSFYYSHKYLRTKLKEIDGAFEKIDWEHEAAIDISNDAWIAARLEHFIESGSSARYWSELRGN